jgi:predicted ATPase/DNA-binding winged helix-turn-helix (wHTH) protein
MDHASGVGPSAIDDRDAPGGSLESGGSLQPDLARGGETLVFGAFSLRVAQRSLEREGSPVQLGTKAFAVLATLVEHAGQVVAKAELLRQVSIVNEDSLRFHIAALRKALGEGRYIANVAGQGYSFVAPVSQVPGDRSADTRLTSPRPLPARPSRLVGRDHVLEALAEQLLAHRFVTVVGPGGVGKTSLALTLAHDLASRFEGDICFFDVGGVFNPELFVGALASALGIPVQPGSAAPGFVTFLQRRRMLLVLDGCEPGVEVAAALAEKLFRETPGVHLLATSREALRSDGEHVHRLFPLDYPSTGEGQTADQALGFAAVQLFVERVTSSLQGFTLTDEEAPFVSEICRKLDGLALAIELAAGRISAYGVREVARQLESQFALMWPGRRTAVARHQTLGATLGWSHQLLTEREQIVFRRLCVFAGAFSLDMATAAVTDEGLSRAEATEMLGSLVSKSLVQFNLEGAYGSYRLLDMTRGYASDRLGEAGEARWMAERHAALIRRQLEDTDADQDAGGARRPGELLDDVSAAIEWSLSSDGDLDVGAALAAASAPIWLQAGLLMECRYWMTRVLNSIDAPTLDAHRQLSIQAALASAETFTDGFTDASFDSWENAFKTAKSLGNIEQQLTCLVVLWAHRIRSPEYRRAFSLARQVEELAAKVSDAGMRAMADWMAGISHHHLGQLATARPLLERSLAGDTLEARQAMMTQFGYDRRIPTMGVLSNLHWLEGRPDEAVRLGAIAVTEARRSPYQVPLCEALTWQALNLHLRGDDPNRVEALLEETIAQARPHFIESYVGLAQALKGLSAFVRGDFSGSDLVSQGLGLLSKSNYEVFHPLFLTELARLRAQAGARLTHDEVASLLRLDAGGLEHWSSAEVRRNLGEVLLRQGEVGKAAQLFSDAADCAERQGALGWALRTALSLARSTVEQASRDRSKKRLAAVLQRFSEGEDTADLQAARHFLADGSN